MNRLSLLYVGLALCCVQFVARAQFTYSEGFTGTEAPGWSYATDESGTNPGPRLTAGTAPVAADPENLNSQIDAEGSGWMRLATTTGNQSNAVALDTAIPSSNNNIKVSFDYTMWGGGASSPADGITVFLWDANVNFDPGAFGGSLGYAQKTGINGLAGGYVGVGLDVFGNYSNDGEGRSGGYGGVNLPDALNKNQIVVRGPDTSVAQDGSGANSFQYLAGTGGKNYSVTGNPSITSLDATSQNLAFGGYNARPDQDAEDYRYFEIELDANNQLIVRARFGYTGVLVTLYTVDMNLSGVVRPDSLRIGFAAATGGSIDVHEIRNLDISASGSIGTKSNYWDNENGNHLWQTALNWNNNTVPQLFDFVAFTDQYAGTKTAQTVVLNNTINPTHKSVTFSGATSYTLNAQNNEILIFDSNTSLNKAYLNVLNSPNGNADHTINVGIRADDELFIQNFVHQTLTLNGAINTNGNPVVFGTTGTTQVNGIISGTGAITTNENGTTVFSAANTYSNTTTVENGILQIRHNTALGTTAAGTTVRSGGTLQVANNITVTGEALTLAGVGEGGIGALNNLSGNNTITGAAVTLSGDTIVSSTAGALTIGGTGAFSAGGNDVTFDTASGSTITVAKVISGTGTDLVKNNAGTLVVSGANTYTGLTTVNAGVLQVQNASGLGTTDAGTVVNSGATLALSGGISTPADETLALSGTGVSGKAALWSESGSNLWNGDAIALTGGTTSVGANTGATLRIDGIMSGTGQSVIITGSGTTVYEDPMSYTGPTLIQSGTLQYAIGNDRISDSSAVVLSSGANYNLNNFSDTVASLAGGGNTQLGSATLTAGGDNTSTTYSGVMSGTGTFTKNGTGTMTFSGANTMTGTLNVNAGTLQVDSSNDFTSSMTLALGGGTFATNGETDTMGAFALNASSTIQYVTGASELLDFSSVASPTGTLTLSNWVGNPFTTSSASTNTGFFVNSGSITTNMTTLASSNSVFEGWGPGVGWKTVTVGSRYELVPTLSGAYRWDRASGNWENSTGNVWTTNTAPPDTTAGTVVYFGDDSESGLNTAAAHTVTLTGNRTVGTMILNGTGGRDYLFTATGSNRTLTFDQTGTGTAYLTVGGNQSNVIGSSNTNNQRVNVALSDNLLIQNNSTATTGLTFGTVGGNHTFTLGANALTVTGTSGTVINSRITGTGGITKNGTGILTLNDNSNNYSGGTTLNQGTLQIGANGALGSGTLALNGGTIQSGGASRTVTSLSSYSINGDFTVSDDASTAGTQDLTINEAGTISGTRTVTVDTVNFTLGGTGGDLTSTGTLVKAGNGTLTLAGDNSTFSGGLVVNAGTVTTGAAGINTNITIGATSIGENYLGTGAILINTGGTLTTNQNSGSGNSADFYVRGTLTNNGGNIAITNLQPTQYNADLYLNGATINQTGGTTSFVDWNDMEVTGASAINVSGGTLAMTLTDDFNTASPNSNPLAINITGGTFNVTQTNAESNSAFTIGTDDTLTLNGSGAAMNINTGAAGNLVSINGSLNLLNNSTLTVTQGTTYLDTTTKINGGSAATAGTLVVKGNLSINEPLVANRPNITIDSNSATSITATDTGSSITNLGTLTKTGTGTTTINSNVNNIEASQVVISGGTLLLGASDQLANSVNLILSGTDPSKGFSTGGNKEVINSLALTSTGTIDMGSGNSILRFLGGGSIASGNQLNVTNWSGTPSYGGGTDQIIFGDVLPASFLNNVYWGPTYGYGAVQLASGEIVPIPEPATIAIGVLLLGYAGYDYRRRKKARAVAMGGN